MSDLPEKLAAPPHSEGRARAQLSNLKTRMGFTVLSKNPHDGQPDWVRVDFMTRTFWRRVAGERGVNAVFEVEEGN